MYSLSTARPHSSKDLVRSCTIGVKVSGYYELAVPFADAAENIGPDTSVCCGQSGRSERLSNPCMVVLSNLD
jgi:hypothetical protein